VSTDDESSAEVQVRLHHERECKRIAELIKAELPEDRGFLLMTVTRGPAKADFSSVDYVATVRPQDAMRLLHDMVDRLGQRSQMAGEPTWKTATVMREMVHELLASHDPSLPLPNPEGVWRSFSQARKGAGTPEQRAAMFRAMAIAALTELERLQREHLERGGRQL
jgi:hypothetical protein